MPDLLTRALDALGTGPLTESALARHVFPLFSRVLRAPGVYLANHSLGRPLDQTHFDVAEALDLWPAKLGNAWDAWLAEQQAFRSRIAALIGASRPDSIIPKTSAGQGLRTVLNALPGCPHVVATRGEFDSVDIILKQYAACGRITVHWIEADPRGSFDTRQITAALEGAHLAVVSQVMYMTGQVMDGLDQLASACHARGARLLVDAYHSAGVLPIDVVAMDADFLIGGCYKYLRGGPGAAFLYISPANLESDLCPLDTGWFAKRDPFLYERPDPPLFAHGGDAFLESTPPVLTWYQSRAGQRFTLGIGVERLRAYSLDRLSRLKSHLNATGIESDGGDAEHGAFLTVRHPEAALIAPGTRETSHCRGRPWGVAPPYAGLPNAGRRTRTRCPHPFAGADRRLIIRRGKL